MGFLTIIPKTAEKMRLTGDYDSNKHRSWNRNPDDFGIKTRLMRGHLNKIPKGQAALVINDEKHGIKGYIGGNVLIEMGLAFYLNIPIYLMNRYPKNGRLYEEIRTMDPIVLNGDLSKIKSLNRPK